MKFIKREKGQGLVEYALLLVLIAVVVIGVLMLLGPQINAIFGRVIGALGGAGAYTYQFQGSPSIKRSSSAGGECRLTAQTFAVLVTDAGTPVPNLPVTANVSIAGIGDESFSGTTNTNGVISWSGKSYDVMKTCGEIQGPATITVAGGALTTSAGVH